MKLPFSIAWRFIMSSKQQSIMIALGIAVGVSVQIFIGLLITGLQDSLIDATIGSSPHITIEAEDDGEILNYDSITTSLSKDSELESVSASVTRPVFLYNDDLDESVLLKGVEDEADGIYNFNEKLVSGRLPESSNEIAVGKLVLENLNLEVGDTVLLRTTSLKEEEVTIVGSLDFKIVALNESWTISTLTTAQTIFELDGATSIEMQLTTPFDSSIKTEEINKLYPDLNVLDWQVQNEELLSGLNGQSVSSLMIQVFVMIAVVLGIASVLAITVLQKARQLGILKAMGIKDKDASRIFLSQGLILGVLGTVLGIGLGVGLIVSFITFATNPDGSPIIPLTMDYNFIALSAGVAIVASLVASIIPARSSLKLNPIEVIRNG